MSVNSMDNPSSLKLRSTLKEGIQEYVLVIISPLAISPINRIK
tara:strand:+ start:94 stop:222 length:129 start_codon:yes stop_codon:yes gene_type:complete